MKQARLESIDMLRGFVIVLMALDHVRDYVGPAPFQPEDLALTTPAWFWTRWITHLCATVFVLLAGSAAFLRGQAAGIPDLSRYLASRGALLIVVEATWISFSWQFGYQVIILQVLWALGAGMLFLAALVWLPRPLIALAGALLILPHNALDGWQPGGLLWQAWHQGGFYVLPGWTGLQGIVFAYPLMPWLGWIAAGYALGPVFGMPAAPRQRILLLGAGVLLLAFIALRAFNLYGDPAPWAALGRGAMFDFMSFMKVSKYPPSLLYLCITGSIALGLLVLFERMRSIPPLLLFGRNPLFFYVLHIALAHAMGSLYMMARYGSLPDFSDGRVVTWPPGYQASLVAVYLAWAVLLVVMALLTTLWRRRAASRG